MAPSNMTPSNMAPSNMFDSIRIPSIQGRRALLVVNCQKDALSKEYGAEVPNPPDFVERIHRIIPYYRQTETEIVWVQTEIPLTDPGSGPMIYDMSQYMLSSQAEQEQAELDDAQLAAKRNATDKLWRSDPRQNLPIWRKTEGGIAIIDELMELLQPEKDLVITKNYYSAFDETPLLMGLRMKMVTSIHICGCLSNVSIIHSAVDAAQHGFDVSVVEDCMGYKDEKLHLDAMKKMADEIGVYGVDSDEVVIEAGGNQPPDADDPDMFSGPGFSGINISPGKSLGTDAEVKMEQDIPALRDKAKIGEGDCKVISNALPPQIVTDAFEKLKSEVRWLAMKHRSGDVPRRVAVQGEFGPDGAVPVYRHPADECPPLKPYSPTVLAIRDEVSKLLDQPFNHVLIQLYRTGSDNISEHSDKTLDIVRGSNIINVSLGAQRKMTLRIKKSAQSKDQQARGERREGQKVTLPHNSVFVLGPKTNARWLHGVRPDKRPEVEKLEAEKVFGGERISLTFRNVGTWTDAERKKIWGQGARRKTRKEALESGDKGDGNVKPADSDEAERMVTAFGRENHRCDFDWDAEYGEGFDALDLVVINNPPPG